MMSTDEYCPKNTLSLKYMRIRITATYRSLVRRRRWEDTVAI